MRKTSQDGGDSTSVTSGYESESKRTSVGIIKTKRDSIKRKVQNFSHESDDTVIEPLLQLDKNETINRSAKYLHSKSKTDSTSEKESDVYSDNKPEINVGIASSNAGIPKTLHNHMNTNIFGTYDGSKVVSTVKSPLLVEIKGCRPAVRSNQTSSIFTTAKINADSLTKSMEPIQVTPVPILSTIEGNVKAGISSDFQQNKSINISPNSDQIPSVQQFKTSYSIQSTSSKSDLNKPSITDPVYKFNNAKEIRLGKITPTESETCFIDKTCATNILNISATSNSKTVDSGMVGKMHQIHSGQPIQQPNLVDLKNNGTTLKKDLEGIHVNKTEEIVSLPKPDISSSRSIITEEKNITSGTSSSVKYLQRQKNTTLEDPRDSDTSLKKTDKGEKVETTTIAPIDTKTNKKQFYSVDAKNSNNSIEKKFPICTDTYTSATVQQKDKKSYITELPKDSYKTRKSEEECSYVTATVTKDSSTPKSDQTSGLLISGTSSQSTQLTGSFKSEPIKKSDNILMTLNQGGKSVKEDSCKDDHKISPTVTKILPSTGDESLMPIVSKNLNITSSPKGAVTMNKLSSSSASMKNTTAEVHKSIQPQNNSIVTPKVTTNKTALPASTISVAKTEASKKSAAVISTIESSKTCAGKSISTTAICTSSAASDVKSSSSKAAGVPSPEVSSKTCTVQVLAAVTTCDVTAAARKSVTSTADTTAAKSSSSKPTVVTSTVDSSKTCTGKSVTSKVTTTSSDTTVTKSSSSKAPVVASAIDSSKTSTVKSISITPATTISSAAVTKSPDSNSAVAISTVDSIKTFTTTTSNTSATKTTSSTATVGKSTYTKSAAVVSKSGINKIGSGKLMSSTAPTVSSTAAVAKSSGTKSTVAHTTVDSIKTFNTTTTITSSTGTGGKSTNTKSMPMVSKSDSNKIGSVQLISTTTSSATNTAALAKSSGTKSAVVASTVDSIKIVPSATTSGSTATVSKSSSSKSAVVASSKTCTEKSNVTTTLTTTTTAAKLSSTNQTSTSKNSIPEKHGKI